MRSGEESRIDGEVVFYEPPQVYEMVVESGGTEGWAN